MSTQWLIGVFLSSNVILLLVQELIGALKEEHKKKKKKGVEARLTEIEGSLDKLEQTDLVLLHDRIWQAFRFFEDKDEISTSIICTQNTKTKAGIMRRKSCTTISRKFRLYQEHRKEN